MKGPGLRIDLDVRRIWRCAKCGKTLRTAGEVTAQRCGCSESSPWMLLEQFVPRPRYVPPHRDPLPEYGDESTVVETPVVEADAVAVEETVVATAEVSTVEVSIAEVATIEQPATELSAVKPEEPVAEVPAANVSEPSSLEIRPVGAPDSAEGDFGAGVSDEPASGEAPLS